MLEQTLENNQTATDSQSNHYSPFTTVDGIVNRNPEALTKGGIRSQIFHEGDELVKAGALIRVGRKLILHEGKYFEYLANESKKQLEGVAK